MIITNDTSPIFRIRQHLPSSVSHALARLDKSVLDKICEIRLYSSRGVFITIDGANKVLTNSGISKSSSSPIIVSSEEIEDFIYKFCKGSVYSHEETLSEFYLSDDSVRVGIAGEAIYKNGVLKGVGKISSINIRIPRHISGCADTLMEHIEYKGFPDGKGILIISSPGGGKTTLLRDLAKQISSTRSKFPEHRPRRVCVIDERREIYMNKVFTTGCVDFLSGVDKIKGIEIASRVLSPEIIICDEIASPTEAEKITRQKNSGTVFIASIHADSYAQLMKKDYIRQMFTSGVFGTVYTLKRTGHEISGSITEYNEND